MTRRLAVSLALVGLSLLAGAGAASSSAQATTTVLVQVIGGGNVQGGNQIDCGAGTTACYASFVGTGSVDLTARNVGGWTIDSWSGCDSISSDDQTCSVDLPVGGADKEITTTFVTVTNPGDSTLTVNNTSDSSTTGGNVGGAGFDCDTGDPPSSGSCAQTYFLGSTITLLEDPADGYEFRGWGGPCSGTAATCTVQLNAPSVAVSSSFGKAASSHTLSVTVTGSGTVTGAGGAISCTSAGGSGCTATVATGSSVTLSATAGAGAGFGGWGGACTVTTTSCTFTVTGDTSVSATFTGAGGGGGGSITYPLTVSISGTGRVTGAGIDCGDGRTTCSVNLASGTTATLTAAATGGAAFTGWGGACSGTTTTCTVTMTAPRSVTASFGAGSGGGGGGAVGVELTLRVQGKGTVSASGGTCASSGTPTTCRQSYDAGSGVTLTATPQPGASFAGWSGACTGTARTCTITLDRATTVTAAFTGARTPAAAGTALRSAGRPAVARTASGFRVTLRFTTTQRGTARVRALRAGRVQTALAFTIAPGAARIGPFPLAKPGFYAFELTLAGRALRWTACLGRCGAAAHARSFSLTRGPARALDAGALWSVSVHFHATLPSGALIRIYRSGRLVRTTRRPLAAGDVSAGPFLLSPGTYRLRLTATDAYGRTRTLGWYAFLS